MFVESTTRINLFKNKSPNFPAVSTHWHSLGTWLSAVLYCADNFDNVKSAIHCVYGHQVAMVNFKIG